MPNRDHAVRRAKAPESGSLGETSGAEAARVAPGCNRLEPAVTRRTQPVRRSRVVRQPSSCVFDVEPAGDDGTVRLSVAGCVDERANFESLIPRIGSVDLLVDLASVEAMNSTGISRWILFLEEITRAPGRRVVLARCSFHGFVMPATMITSMTTGAHVESLQLPYGCDCSEELALVASLADLGRTKVCSLCGCRRTLAVARELIEPLLGELA